MGSYIRFDCAMKRLLRNTVCGVGGIADDIAEYEGSHMLSAGNIALWR